MAYALQQLRALIAEHPDRAAGLQPAVAALESAIDAEPAVCLYRVRTLFEVVHLTIAPKLGVDLSDATEFPARNSKLIKAMNFAFDGHPEGVQIGTSIAKLLGSINGTASALAELSNYANLRHGGALDWPVLQRQHAHMLGALCDALVSFLFHVAWSRDVAEIKEELLYSADSDYNIRLDEEFGNVEVAGGSYPASLALFHLDPLRYRALQSELGDASGEEADEGVAA